MMKNNKMMKMIENDEKGDKNAMSHDHRTPVSEPQVHSILG